MRERMIFSLSCGQMRGHFLCVLDITQIHPQALQKTFLTKAVTLAATMQRHDFALGNSCRTWVVRMSIALFIDSLRHV